jgi:uncharacterized protein (TIGR02246 family)
MKMLILGLSSALLVGLAACQGGEPALVFSGDVTQDWETARANGDADAIAALHTEDAQVMPPNAPMVEGRSAIRAYYRNVFENRSAPARFDEREVIVFGRMTYRQGIYEMEMPNGKREYGKFMQIWKSVDGKWQLHRAMWSSSEPIPTSAGAPGG